MSIVVFVGPSIRQEQLPETPGVKYVLPIRRGDMAEYATSDTLLILDGEFKQSLSVSPKEILRAMSLGQRVIGASSMGALRASELHTFGMLGIGWVFERFAQSDVRRDDDVALTYDPFSMAAVTVPMVNVIYWMEKAVDRGLVTLKESRAIIVATRKIFFADRSETSFMKLMKDILGQDRVRLLLEQAGGSIPDIKELDGLRAIAFSCTTEVGYQKKE